MNEIFIYRLCRTLVLCFFAAGFLTAYPIVLMLSFVLDGHPPGEDIATAAVEAWASPLVGFSHDSGRGLIAVVQGPRANISVLLAGVETCPDGLEGAAEAVQWLQHRFHPGQPVAVFLLQQASPERLAVGHLACENEWLNGALVQQGLARVTHRNPVQQKNIGRGALLQLQGQAQLNRAGIWRRDL